jgi:hypothetical protein
VVEKIQAKAMFPMWTMWLKIKRPSRLTKTPKVTQIPNLLCDTLRNLGGLCGLKNSSKSYVFYVDYMVKNQKTFEVKINTKGHPNSEFALRPFAKPWRSPMLAKVKKELNH